MTQLLPVHPLTGRTAVGWRANGRPIWPVAGAQDPPNPPNPPASPPNPPTSPADQPAPTPERQLSQSQVNEIVARESAKAKEKAERDLAASLGVSIEEAARIVKEATDRTNAQKSDAERAKEAADKAKREAEEEKTKTQRERHSLWSDSVLITLGAPTDEGKLARLRGMLTVQVGASRDEIKADAEQVKKDFPQLFSTTAPPPAPSSDPSGRPPAPKANGDAYTAGMERAKARYAKPEPIKVPGLN